MACPAPLLRATLTGVPVKVMHSTQVASTPRAQSSLTMRAKIDDARFLFLVFVFGLVGDLAFLFDFAAALKARQIGAPKDGVTRGELADFGAVGKFVFGEQSLAHFGRNRDARLGEGATRHERDRFA